MRKSDLVPVDWKLVIQLQYPADVITESGDLAGVVLSMSSIAATRDVVLWLNGDISYPSSRQIPSAIPLADTHIKEIVGADRSTRWGLFMYILTGLITNHDANQPDYSSSTKFGGTITYPHIPLSFDGSGGISVDSSTYPLVSIIGATQSTGDWLIAWSFNVGSSFTVFDLSSFGACCWMANYTPAGYRGIIIAHVSGTYAGSLSFLPPQLEHRPILALPVSSRPLASEYGILYPSPSGRLFFDGNNTVILADNSPATLSAGQCIVVSSHSTSAPGEVLLSDTYPTGPVESSARGFKLPNTPYQVAQVELLPRISCFPTSSVSPAIIRQGSRLGWVVRS